MPRIKASNSMNPNGFTLIEILIAIFILAVVLSILYSSYSGTLRIIDETESEAVVYEMARITLERIVYDLKSAYFYKSIKTPDSEENTLLEAGFLGEDISLDGRGTDKMRFNSRAHLALDDENEAVRSAVIAYYVKESEGEDGLILYRSDTPEFQEPPEEEEGGLVLCDGLYSVNITYQDNNGEVHDNWDSSVEPFKGKLPVMVSIGLEFPNKSDPESPLKFMTSVSLPLAMDRYGKES
ncbi:type II secretion system protein J [Thermodesulfobacteriota bacterium]